MLRRYATKIMQLNAKRGNKKYPETWYEDKQAFFYSNQTRCTYFSKLLYLE
jgi:hypothetical protein